MIDIALDGNRGADPFDDDPLDIDDAATLTEAGVDPIAAHHGRGRLRRAAVDVDVSAPARPCRLGAGPGEAHRPEPLVETGRGVGSGIGCAVDLLSLARTGLNACVVFLADQLTSTQCVI